MSRIEGIYFGKVIFIIINWRMRFSKPKRLREADTLTFNTINLTFLKKLKGPYFFHVGLLCEVTVCRLQKCCFERD